eukprot:m.30447 g.30447  ORF g.30447 m.30447 type:complete len:198 (-) comp8203_c0_seq2:2082-2675(-)
MDLKVSVCLRWLCLWTLACLCWGNLQQYNTTRYEEIHGSPLSLLFICAGNTCRSATAHAMATSLLGDNVAQSAGLRIRNGVGDPMNHHAQVFVCGSVGCYDGLHSSKHLKDNMVMNATHIYVMDKGLLEEFKERFATLPMVLSKVDLLCNGQDVPDPYFNSAEEQTLPLSVRRGSYMIMNMRVKKCLLERLDEIFSV